jgi:hypothetical protein
MTTSDAFSFLFSRPHCFVATLSVRMTGLMLNSRLPCADHVISPYAHMMRRSQLTAQGRSYIVWSGGLAAFMH